MQYMRYILLILGVSVFCGFITGLILYPTGRLQSFSSTSHLHFFETRIESVDEEFMRRSPELRKNFARFQKCMRASNTCHPIPILKERDQIIKKLWPQLLTRLLVEDDWGNKKFTAENHQIFQRDIRKAGGKEKARSCVPKIHYYLISGKNTIHPYEGLYCP